MDLTPLETKNLSGAVGADSHAERSLITSKVGSGSGGITSANSSRGFGTGAGSLNGHETTAVSSGIAKSGLNARGPAASGGGGKAARSREEIELVFDKNKGRIYSLYARALRDNAELQGKLVLEFTIAPSGEVTMCRVSCGQNSSMCFLVACGAATPSLVVVVIGHAERTEVEVRRLREH
jgi:periplasmic protein TonB